MRKSLIFLLILTSLIVNAHAGKWITIKSAIPEPANVDLISSSGETSIIKLCINGFEMSKVQTSSAESFIISLDDATPLLIKDAPDIPKVTASVIIGTQSIMKVEVISSKYKEFYGIEIAPSKGNLYRDVDPATIPFSYGKIYDKNDFFPGKLVGLRDPFFIRDYRGQTVIMQPFQYNPVTKVLRVYYEMLVKVSNINQKTKANINPVTTPSSIDKEFLNIYTEHFINFNKNAKYTPVGEQGNMLVISHGPFMAEMQVYVNWKNTIGIPTEMVDVSTIGGTSAIKSYVANYYNTQGLTYLLLVGDAAQVPTSSTGAGDSDNDYGYIVGNDHYPDIFVGRFSAETLADVETQVDRTIDYELNPLVFPEWYNKGIGIASSQGPGDDNELDYEHVRNMQADLLAFTYTNCPELFDGSQGGLDAPGNPSSAMVSAEINGGSGVILYCGHGSTTSWGSSGFSNSNINSLTNLRKLPFIWSVACVNGNFVNNTCFAETWLRATDNGEPTGAIATLMSTINQSWSPPMSGQDEMVDILVESYANNIKRTFGGLSMNGCMQMNDDYGTGGENMTDTWNLFGDPSLIVRTDTPKVMTVTHNNTIFIGATQFQINCNVDDALVALTIDHQIIGTGYITGGLVNISFSPLLTLDTMTVAVTAFNYIPYLADVPIIPASGPYVIYNGYQLDDNSGNSNGMADYGESILLDLEIRNVGIAQANAINVKLTSQDAYILMLDTLEYYGNILADSVLMINSAFSFLVMDSIPDNHNVLFNFSATDGTNTWSGGFNIKIHAPFLEFDNYSISDPTGNNNSKIDAGETVDMTISIENNGSAEAFNVRGVLLTSDPYITVNTSSPLLYGDMLAASNAQQSFSVSADLNTPPGHQADFSLYVYADSGYVCNTSFSVIVGQIPILIIDLDVNNNSAPAMQTAIQSLGLTYDYYTSFPADLNLYSSVFLCLGIYWDNYVLDNSEGQLLTDYLNNGGCLYMEGGDTWFYDQQTPVHSMFSINPGADGSADLGMLIGDTATFTDGMVFNYSGDNSYIDHIDAMSPAFSIFHNQNPFYGSGVAFDQGSYKTIAASHEFGGLDDAAFPSTKEELMAQYLEFFGLYTSEVNASFFAVPTSISAGNTINFYDNSTGNIFMWFWNFPGGTPQWSSIQNPSVTYNTPGTYDVELIVSDGLDLDTLIIQNYIDVSGGINSISGNVTYHNPAQTPIDNITLILKTLSGIEMDSVITDLNGAYTFLGVIYDDYVIEMSCKKSWGGVNASDGLEIMRHFVGLNLLVGLPLVAADVDASTFVNTSDALMCVQRFVGLINSFPVGDWAFDQDTLSVSGGTTFSYDPMSLCYGDMDGSYLVPAGKIQAKMELVNESVMYINSEEDFEVPLIIDRDISISAISLVINYPENFLELTNVIFDQDEHGNPLYKVRNGELRIGWYDVNPIKLLADDNLVILRFRAKKLTSWPENGLELKLNTGSEVADPEANAISNILIKSRRLLAELSPSAKFSLDANHPNPFYDETQISFVLPEAAHVNLSLYNILGEEVKIIQRNEYYDEGRNKIVMEKGDLRSGIYIYKLEANGRKSNYSASGRLVIM